MRAQPVGWTRSAVPSTQARVGGPRGGCARSRRAIATAESEAEVGWVTTSLPGSYAMAWGTGPATDVLQPKGQSSPWVWPPVGWCPSMAPCIPIGQISSRKGVPLAGMKPTGMYARTTSASSNRLRRGRRIQARTMPEWPSIRHPPMQGLAPAPRDRGALTSGRMVGTLRRRPGARANNAS
jgi:hypothetical protein